MQGKRVIKLGDREYLVEETFSGEYAVYLAEDRDTEEPLSFSDLPVSSHIGYQGAHPEPGTLVVILARVAAPPSPIEVERRRYQDRHWEAIEEKRARRAISRDYGKNTELIWRELASGMVVGAGNCQYRRREGG